MPSTPSTTTRRSKALLDQTPCLHPATTVAAVVAGALFVAEALISPFSDAHVGYHAVNVPLNLALLVGAFAAARAGRAVVGRAGTTGGWGTGALATLAALGGLWVLAVEGLSTAEAPGVVDGIAHTAVLASLLLMVPLGLGLRRIAVVPGTVIAAAAAMLVVMVLAGLDQPEAFLVPEAVLGIGWLALGFAVRSGSTDARS